MPPRLLASGSCSAHPLLNPLFFDNVVMVKSVLFLFLEFLVLSEEFASRQGQSS